MQVQGDIQDSRYLDVHVIEDCNFLPDIGPHVHRPCPSSKHYLVRIDMWWHLRRKDCLFQMRCRNIRPDIELVRTSLVTDSNFRLDIVDSWSDLVGTFQHYKFQQDKQLEQWIRADNSDQVDMRGFPTYLEGDKMTRQNIRRRLICLQ